MLQEVNSGVQTSGPYVNFSPGQCVDFTILGGNFGDKYDGQIYTPAEYHTGTVAYN